MKILLIFIAIVACISDAPAEGRKVVVVRRDSSVVTGELLSVRDSALVITKLLKAREGVLQKTMDSLVVVPLDRVGRLVVVGRSHGLEGLSAGMGGGIVVGALIGSTFAGSGPLSSVERWGNGFAGGLVGFLVGSAVGGIIGGSIHDDDEVFEGGPTLRKAVPKEYPRYVEGGEPEWLEKEK